MASASAASPSTIRGPGRVTTVSSTGRTAWSTIAVIPPHPGRAATIAGVVP